MALIVALDLETTGLDPAQDAVIEIGAVKFSDKRIESEYSTLINPRKPISSFITNLTGITNQDVALLLHTGLSGAAPTHLRDHDRLIPITFRLRSDERTRIDEIANLEAVSTLEELRETLRLTLQEALEFNRQEALAAAGAEFREEKIAV